MIATMHTYTTADLIEGGLVRPWDSATMEGLQRLALDGATVRRCAIALPDGEPHAAYLAIDISGKLLAAVIVDEPSDKETIQ